jgi:O-antigen ligase
MLIIFLILFLTGCFFVVKPRAAIYVLAILIAFWIEWKFNDFFGVKLGIIDVAVVGGLIGAMMHMGRTNYAGIIPLKGLVISYMTIAVLSVMLSPEALFSKIGKILWAPYKEIYITLSFFLFFIFIDSKEILRKVIWLVLISASVSSFFGIIQGITKKPITLMVGTYAERVPWISADMLYGSSRVFGTLWHSNDFGGFLIWPLSISISLFLLDKNSKYRRYLSIFILMQGLALLMTASRAGWMGFLISFLIISIYTKIYKKISFVFMILWIFLLLLSIKTVMPNIDLIPGNITNRFFSIEKVKTDDAMIPRYERWKYFLNMSLERPLTGFGVTATDEVVKHFEDIAASPHQTYLAVAVKRGYIALFIILIILLRFLRNAFSIYKSSDDMFIKGMSLGILSGLVGLFGVAALFATFLEETQVNLLFWLLLAVTMRTQSFAGYDDSKDNLTAHNP